jgi:hypothetical protein
MKVMLRLEEWKRKQYAVRATKAFHPLEGGRWFIISKQFASLYNVVYAKVSSRNFPSNFFYITLLRAFLTL